MKLSENQKQVYQDQDTILRNLKKIPSFAYVLSGGTALARFYLRHRFSEDLDFFCESLDFSFETIEGYINRLRRQGLICELVGRTDKKGLLKVATYDVFGKVHLKVDFLEDPFSGMWKPTTQKTESGVSFKVDALDMITYRKFYALLEQWHRSHEITRFKDLCDLYWLHSHHRSLWNTIFYYRKHHVPLDEEKILLIFSSINGKKLREGIKGLGIPVSDNKMAGIFEKTVDKILKRELKK